jgi:transposase InsO family protein
MKPPREGGAADTTTRPQEASVHANARLTPRGRRTLIERIQSGRPVAHVADEMGIAPATAYKWWERFRHFGWAGLQDRSSRPRRCPHQTPLELERRIEELRRSRKLGPARIAGILEMATSTVHRVLCRRGLNRLRFFDRPSGRVIRRIETSRPGELVHIDVKKLGRIPDGGGHRVLGREARTGSVAHRGLGYAYIHSAVDAYSRLAYSEVLDAENRATCTNFLERAHAFFVDRGVSIERVLTDNGNGYRSHAWAALCSQLELAHTRTRAYRPQTNGKVERFNRTLLDEWGYVRPYHSEDERTRALDRWLHLYNHHRAHTALGGKAPMDILSNLPDQYS